MTDECKHGLNIEWCDECQASNADHRALPARGARTKRTVDPKMRDLLASGLLSGGSRLHAHYKGRLFMARVEDDGSIFLDGHYFGSPTGAI